MNYPREGARDYAELTDGCILAPGRFGRAVKALVDRDTWYVVRPRWRLFIQEQAKRGTLQYATPEYFARTYSNYAVAPKVETIPPKFREVLVGGRMRLEPDDAA